MAFESRAIPSIFAAPAALGQGDAFSTPLVQSGLARMHSQHSEEQLGSGLLSD